MSELKMTGERLVTSFNNHYGKYEHLHRYAFSFQFAKQKVVLDVASGEGYGTNLLSNLATEIHGVDISKEAVEHAKLKYRNSNINFHVSPAHILPFEDNKFDTIVSFETIEHLLEQDEMISEMKRVLKDDGILILSSPEKNIYKERDPDNKFHLKELTLIELEVLLSKYFDNKIILRQFMGVGSFILPKEDYDIKDAFSLYEGDYTQIKKGLTEEIFFNRDFFNVIICSAKEIEIEKYSLQSFFNSYAVYDNILNEKEKLISNLNKEKNSLSEKLHIIKSNKVFKILNRIRYIFK
ncbi:class I SAM-dependent methyltransferase [Empedobacter sp. UBA7494]|uniref:class I SAM-dependent methyltransferase n=1 Tax=Empedobacter sp. UBA7494 TaxID=1946450 RepID=UPI0025C3811B|nr:class I SAM-dependent methyltransferase [Empedobacter sp. UBA7494]